MTEHPRFIPGLALGRSFYEQAGRAVVERVVAPDGYAAALVGRGSDVLGLDTERSTDHDWGPRFQVFLPDEDYDSESSTLDEALRAALPGEFRGFNVGFSDPDSGQHAPHRVEITTVSRWLLRHLGVRDVVSNLGPLDWLTFPEQRLVEVTSGEVFHDPVGALTAARKALAAYPRDVWLYRMACQWQRLAQAEGFIGRCAEAGDASGARLVAARVLKDAMKLCFLMERRYAPYDKWLGTAFARLAVATRMQPLIARVLDAADYPAMEPGLTAIYALLGETHNALGVTGPMDASPRPYFSRPYTVMRSDRFANALLGAMQNDELRRLPVRMGGIDQLVDNTDFIENPTVYRRALSLYAPRDP